MAAGSRHEAVGRAEGYGADRRVVQAIRSVPAASLTDTNYGQVLSDWHTAVGAFFGSLATQSVFFAMLAAGMRRVPLAQRLGAVTTGATAVVVGEGQITPISQLILSGLTLDPVRALAMIVLGKDVVALETAEAESLVEAELKAAVVRAVDAKFLNIVSTGVSPLSSAGSSANAMDADLKALLDAVNVNGGALFWAMAPGLANAAAIYDDTHQMTPLGGTLLGLPAIVSDAITAGTVYLLNAAGIAANADTMGLDSSEQATVVMESSPDSPATATTVGISLWQLNLVGLLAAVRFGAKKFRSDAVALMTNVSWGSGNSP